VTGDEFRKEIALLEARANMAYGAYVNRRTSNAGRYWALGSVIAAMHSESYRIAVDTWLAEEVDALETEFYGTLD
jgi:hypothetical protein